MLSQIQYLIRSKIDGKYLTANISTENKENSGYLLLFKENFEALSYLNTHGANVAKNFTVESISLPQLKTTLQRWGFAGIGLVEDPLLPNIKFMTL